MLINRCVADYLVFQICMTYHVRNLQNRSALFVGKQTMNTIEQTFHDEIEVERLWAATKQGNFVFFSILPF